MKHQYVIDHDLVGRYRRGVLPPVEVEGFEVHLLGCRECQSLLAVDELLERGLRAGTVRDAVAHSGYAPLRHAPVAMAAALVLAVGGSAVFWLRSEPQVAPIQAGLSVFHLALTRGAEPQTTVLQIPPDMVWYAIELDAPSADERCCRIVIERIDGTVVWAGESPVSRDSGVVRVLLNRDFVDSGSYRIALFAGGPERLLEHTVRIELGR